MFKKKKIDSLLEIKNSFLALSYNFNKISWNKLQAYGAANQLRQELCKTWFSITSPFASLLLTVYRELDKVIPSPFVF